MGVLYHLPQPWRLLKQMSRAVQGAFVWTHYAEPHQAKATRHHYQGRLYREWFFLFEPLSGLSPTSFWPTRADLLRMFAEVGFVDTTIVEDNPSHPHGPAITFATRQG
jgi:hypothetical protein